MTKKIVMAEDDRQLTKLVKAVLETNGYDITVVHDGATALKEISAKKPDLVILDVNMPVMDGYRICQTLNEDISFEPIPKIIVATSRNSQLDQQIVKMAGVDAYLNKPYSLEEMLSKVKHLLEDNG